jgi:hypothetical protein
MIYCIYYLSTALNDPRIRLLWAVVSRTLDRRSGPARNALIQHDRVSNAHAVDAYRKSPHLVSDSRLPARFKPILAVHASFFILLLCLGIVPGWAQENDQQQMRGLDEQVQAVKSDVLGIAAELSLLEEKLLYPSGTQVAIFVAQPEVGRMRLDSVRLRIDGQLATHHIYSAKELEALHKGGVQRIYVGNVSTGDHQLEVLVDGKLESGADFSRTEIFTFRKEVKPKLMELTLVGPDSGKTPITLGEW